MNTVELCTRQSRLHSDSQRWASLKTCSTRHALRELRDSEDGARNLELSKDAALFSKAALPNALSFVNKPCRELMRL